MSTPSRAKSAKSILYSKTTEKMISLMIIEDHRIVADGLERLINENSDNQIVAVCESIKEASTRLAELRPQIVLLDVAFPDCDGIDAIPELQQQSPETHFIMLTMFADASVIQRGMQAGAQGYLFRIYRCYGPIPR